MGHDLPTVERLDRLEEAFDEIIRFTVAPAVRDWDRRPWPSPPPSTPVAPDAWPNNG